MTDNNNNAEDTQTLPEKLAARIEQFQHSGVDEEPIIANGDAALTSEHPVEVVEYFLNTHRSRWSAATFADYSYDLTRLLEYCEYTDIEDISTISSRDIEGFRDWRKRDGNIVLATIHAQLSNIRVFIRWCERVEIIEEGLAEEIVLPDLEASDVVSHTRIEPETAARIRAYYDDLPYVPQEYAIFSLMWSVLIRLGGLRSLDLEHYHRDEGYIELEHRPEEDTPLKNGASDVEGEGGEREINLPEWVCDVLNTYIDGTGDPNHPKRKDATDEFGRQPLFTTSKGRVSKTTIRRQIYRITQPCRHGEDCPEDLNPDTCAARNEHNKLSRCPSNVSPHPIRRGGICYQLNQGVSKQTICERADVSRAVLNKHYDLRTKQEARKQRRQKLQPHLDGYEDAYTNHDSNQGTINSYSPISSFIANSTSVEINELTKQSRRIKGAVGFVCYLLFIFVDVLLITIGNIPSITDVVA